MNELEDIKTELEAGETFISTSKKYSMPVTSLRAMLTEDEIKRYAQIRAKATEQRRIEKRRTGKYLKEGKIEVDMVEYPHKRPYLTKEDAQKIDLWDYPNDYDKIGKKDLVAYEGLFGISTANIPFMHYQPAKRIQTIAHGLFSYTHDKSVWLAKSNWVKLLKPEMPLVEVLRHDLDTLNASVGFTESLDDRLLTQEDSCFISSVFADRFQYKEQHKVSFITSHPLPQQRVLVEGECIEAFDEEDEITRLNTVKHGGEFKIVKQKQMGKIWLNEGLVTAKKTLQTGDKLLSLSGLKVTICDIRPEQDKDIMIHPKQVISKTGEVKGALVKELQTCSKIMVGMRKDEIMGNTENLSRGGSVSSTLYPVLKLYAPKLLTRLIHENSDLPELLKVLHLCFDNGTIKLTPEIPEGSIIGGHNIWEPRILENPELFTGSIDDYETVQIEKTIKGNEVTWERLIWEELYIPQFVKSGYFKKGRFVPAAFHEYENKTFDENSMEYHGGKLPFTIKPRGGNSEFDKIVEKVLFCKIKSGKFLKAIPTLKTDKVIMSDLWKDKFGEDGFCTVFREPVIGFDNIFCMKIEYETGLSPYVIRLPLDIVKAASGDYDGDCWAVIPYKEPAFMLDKHEIPVTEPNMTEIDLKTELIPRSNSELIAEAIEWRKDKVNNGKLTKKFGGARKRAAFYQGSIDAQKRILENAAGLEDILKTERHDERWEETLKEHKRELESLTNGRKVKDKTYGEWSLHEIVTGKKNSWFRLLGYKPGGFWADLFAMPITAEDKKMQALKQNKKIILGGL
jgi:hypothetical protein